MTAVSLSVVLIGFAMVGKGCSVDVGVLVQCDGIEDAQPYYMSQSGAYGAVNIE